ncbi:MAG: LPS-assembly protein LptD, partial [Spirochaetales bacterium]|nr:LPS-assembly protein LptD [Spirochaetales bacterium]
ADKIIFNQTEKTISAYGNIEYEIIREGDNEYFHGESLVFEIETWEGIFFEGVSENSRLIKYEELGTEEEVAFFFSGDYIYRSSDDRIILKEGSITSVMAEDPYYRVDADKIWVLGPGEWAIKNAVLFVGRIPVFYFPYFFLPGDELIFNPAIGYKEIDGTFINTTTYLIGLKDDEDTDTFSFLKSSNDHPVEKIRQGLFLISSKKDLDTESWWYSTGSSLKLLVDYYSRKGFFFGLDGSLHFDSFLKGFDIFTAISLSKYLYKYNENEDGIIIGPYIYTSFIKDDSGSYISVYEDSYLFGHHLPFRFAFDIDMDITNSWLRMNLDLPIYSDTKFRSHFMNREEGLKWAQFLNTNDEESVTENEITSLNWVMAGTLTPAFESLSPVVENISLKKIEISLNWQSSVLNYPDRPIPEDSLSFFYPTSLILPNISGSISGTIFKSPDTDSVEISEQLLIGEFEFLKDPWTVEKSDFPLVDYDILIDPEKLEYIPLEISSINSFFTNKLKYSISPSILVNTIFSSDVPESPDAINFKSDYSIFSTQTTSVLDYSFNLYDSFLTVSNILNFSMNYKQYFNPYGMSADWDSYLEQGKNATNYKATNNVIVINKPFIKNNFLSESSLTYTLNTTVYNRYYDNDPAAEYFIDDYFRWNKEGISSHSADMELKYYDSNNYQILKLDTILPPKNPELYPGIILSSDHFTV